MNAVDNFKHNGRKVTIHYDEFAESPRTAYDNLATFVCWHRNMNLGDEQIEGMPEAELRALLTERGEEIVALLPLYIYEHGGVTMSTGAYSDRWDSGQVGWSFVTKSSAEKMGCVGAKWDTARYCEAIKSEVETYDMYLRGAVYGFEIEGTDGDELDACWGFYGLDDVREAAREAADDSEDPAVDRAAEELASRVTFAGIGEVAS